MKAFAVRVVWRVTAEPRWDASTPSLAACTRQYVYLQPMSNGEGRWAAREASTAQWLLSLTTLGFVLSVHAAVLTDGFRVSLFTPDGPSQFFDATADALLEGRVDVDPYHIGREAFLFGDRTYGYFGVTPALLRMPLHALVPGLWGHWERGMILLAVCVTVLAAASLAATARGVVSSAAGGAARALFLLMVGLGSTTLFLSSRPNVYHEATAWGTALTLAGLAVLARWLHEPTPLGAAAICVLCSAALHARMVVGFGLLVAVGIVVALQWLRGVGRFQVGGARAPFMQTATLVLGLVVACGSYAALNYAKFGMLASLPLAKHLQSSPERLARTGHKVLSLGNVPANVYDYLMPWNVRGSAEDAAVRAVPAESLVTTPGMDYDWREPVISLSAASPALFLLAALGLFALLGRDRGQRALLGFWPLVIGSAASGAGTLLYSGITQRYGHDLLSVLVVLGACALPSLEQATAPRLRRSSLVLALACVWSILAFWQVGEAYRAWGGDLRIAPVRHAIMLPAYARELRLQPRNATTHSEMAFIYHQDGQPDRARFHLERALALDPRHEPSILLLARIRQASDRAGAIALLQHATVELPRSVQIRGMLAALLLAGGRRQEALEQLRVAEALANSDTSRTASPP